MFETILNPIFYPILNLKPIVFIVIISFFISLLITVIYKLATDQNLMKELKDEMKKSQKQMKELKEHPQKMMEMQKKAMAKNMEYMKHSMKPMLFTMIPIIIIFGWLNAHLAYDPIMPNNEFTTTALFEQGTTGQVEISIIPENQIKIISNLTQEIENNKAEWKLKGPEGEYTITYSFDGEKQTKDLMISNKREYTPAEKKIKNSNFRSIKINNDKLIVFNLFGWKLGWLGSYIILSIIFSMGLRKLMKLH